MHTASADGSAAPRVCYVHIDDGHQLPVVDITNPLFEDGVDERALPALTEAWLRSTERLLRIPLGLRRRLVRRSLLLGQSAGQPTSFVNGMTTYLLKLPPEQLAATYHLGNLDQRAAEGITSAAVRMRLRAVARLLADGLHPQLALRPDTPLHLLDLGGGTASDSLNALILINHE